MPFKLLTQNHRLLIIVSIVYTSSNVMYCTTCTPAKCFILVRSEKLGDSLGDVKNINKDAFRSQSPQPFFEKYNTIQQTIQQLLLCKSATGYRENSIQNSIRPIRIYVYQDNVHQQGKFVRILNINFPFNSFPCL